MRKAKPKIELPYEFVSPYPPDECAERLEMKQANYFGTTILVDTELRELNSYRFSLDVFAEGTNKHPTKDVVLTVVGRLDNAGGGGTHVEMKRLGARQESNLMKAALVLGAFGLLFSFLPLPIFRIGSAVLGSLFATLLVVLMVVKIDADGRNEVLQEVVELVKHTLTVQGNNSPTDQYNPHAGLLHGENRSVTRDH